MTEKEILGELKLNKTGIYEDGAYLVDIKDSDEWGKIHSRLEKSDKAVLVEDEDDYLNFSGSRALYNYNDEYNVILMADFDEDAYQLIIEKE